MDADTILVDCFGQELGAGDVEVLGRDHDDYMYEHPDSTLSLQEYILRVASGANTGASAPVNEIYPKLGDDSTETGAGAVISHENPNTIAGIVAQNPNFSILASAIMKASPSVGGALNDPDASLTLFAPTNAAFAALARSGVILDDLLENTEMLDTILSYHVINQKLASTELKRAKYMTLQGEEISVYPDFLLGITIRDATVMFVPASVSIPDLFAKNGIVHGIDVVLLPNAVASKLPSRVTTRGKATQDPYEFVNRERRLVAKTSVAEVVSSDSDLTTLLTAIQRAKPSLQEALRDETSELTLFAPTNDAFSALSRSGFDLAKLLADGDALTAVLSYHVLTRKILSEDFKRENYVTLHGERVSVYPDVGFGFTVRGKSVMIFPAGVSSPDLIGGKGVVHIIDAVLLPEAALKFLPQRLVLRERAGVDAGAGASAEGVSTGVSFTKKKDKDESIFDYINREPTLSKIGTTVPLNMIEAIRGTKNNFTLFAPTNAAFGTLASYGIDITFKDALYSDLIWYHALAHKFSIKKNEKKTYRSVMGEDVYISTSKCGNTIRGKSERGFAVNILDKGTVFGNTVVYKIDGVLLPKVVLDAYPQRVVITKTKMPALIRKQKAPTVTESKQEILDFVLGDVPTIVDSKLASALRNSARDLNTKFMTTDGASIVISSVSALDRLAAEMHARSSRMTSTGVTDDESQVGSVLSRSALAQCETDDAHRDLFVSTARTICDAITEHGADYVHSEIKAMFAEPEPGETAIVGLSFAVILNVQSAFKNLVNAALKSVPLKATALDEYSATHRQFDAVFAEVLTIKRDMDGVDVGRRLTIYANLASAVIYDALELLQVLAQGDDIRLAVQTRGRLISRDLRAIEDMGDGSEGDADVFSSESAIGLSLPTTNPQKAMVNGMKRAMNDAASKKLEPAAQMQMAQAGGKKITAKAISQFRSDLNSRSIATKLRGVSGLFVIAASGTIFMHDIAVASQKRSGAEFVLDSMIKPLVSQITDAFPV